MRNSMELNNEKVHIVISKGESCFETNNFHLFHSLLALIKQVRLFVILFTIIYSVKPQI